VLHSGFTWCILAREKGLTTGNNSVWSAERIELSDGRYSCQFYVLNAVCVGHDADTTDELWSSDAFDCKQYALWVTTKAPIQVLTDTSSLAVITQQSVCPTSLFLAVLSRRQICEMLWTPLSVHTTRRRHITPRLQLRNPPSVYFVSLYAKLSFYSIVRPIRLLCCAMIMNDKIVCKSELSCMLRGQTDRHTDRLHCVAFWRVAWFMLTLRAFQRCIVVHSVASQSQSSIMCLYWVHTRPVLWSMMAMIDTYRQ